MTDLPDPKVEKIRQFRRLKRFGINSEDPDGEVHLTVQALGHGAELRIVTPSDGELRVTFRGSDVAVATLLGGLAQAIMAGAMKARDRALAGGDLIIRPN